LHVSEAGIWAARRIPYMTRPVLWAWGRYYGRSRKRPHWLFTEMGNVANYRVPYRVRLRDGQLLDVAINDLTGQEICRLGYTEGPSLDIMTAIVKPGDTFFDLGAHVGHFTVVASRLVGAGGMVHSFEPDAETCRWLEGNVKVNSLANVTVNQAAVCDKVGYQDFELRTIDMMAANSLAKPNSSSGRFIRVRTTSIDEYCAEGSIKRIDFLKIDVEGAEIDVLRGARAALSGEVKPKIHIEFHPKTQEAFGRSLPELAETLLACGYQLLRITDEGPREFWLNSEEPRVFNVLALSSDDAKRLRPVLVESAIRNPEPGV